MHRVNVGAFVCTEYQSASVDSAVPTRSHRNGLSMCRIVMFETSGAVTPGDIGVKIGCYFSLPEFDGRPMTDSVDTTKSVRLSVLPCGDIHKL